MRLACLRCLGRLTMILLCLYYIVIYCIACPIGWRFSFRRDEYFFFGIFVLPRALRRVNYDVLRNIEINLNRVTQ